MCVRLDDLNHSRACPTSTPSSGCRVPNTRHRVSTAPTENQDLLFSISAPATSASIHMKGRRGKQGPNQVTDLKLVLLRETSSKPLRPINQQLPNQSHRAQATSKIQWKPGPDLELAHQQVRHPNTCTSLALSLWPPLRGQQKAQAGVDLRTSAKTGGAYSAGWL